MQGLTILDFEHLYAEYFIRSELEVQDRSNGKPLIIAKMRNEQNGDWLFVDDVERVNINDLIEHFYHTARLAMPKGEY